VDRTANRQGGDRVKECPLERRSVIKQAFQRTNRFFNNLSSELASVRDVVFGALEK